MSLGGKIKQYREENNMTQKDIAEILEVEPGTISKYESGMIEPNIESLKKLAETFHITIDELLKDDEEGFDVTKISVLEVLREQKEMKLKGNLYHNTQIKFSYNTNHIEGSSLTEDQTRYIFETNTILFEGETVASVDDILPYLEDIDLVLVMSVEPGKGGQKFIESSIDKINYLYELREENDYHYVIEVDGGINDITAKMCKCADILVIGSFITNGNYQEQIDKIKVKTLTTK